MTKRLRITLAVVAVVALLAMATLLTATALAQEETLTPEQAVPAPRMWGGHGRGMMSETALEAAAEVLGMTADELSTQLWGGKTLADLAEEKGVDLEDVRDAVSAAQEAALRDRIEQAVEDGNLTREHADWLLEGLDKGFLGGGRFGGWGAFRGCGGRHGRSGDLGTAPSETGFGRVPAGRTWMGTDGL
jgi:hypothetical protein